MVANKSSENAGYRNALLTTVASREDEPSQRFLQKTLQASRHTLRKAILRRAYVDDTRDNFWGGLSRKRRSDSLSKEDWQVIVSFWDTATTISPIAKDILYQRTGPWQFLEHPKHYLQESQVCATSPKLHSYNLLHDVFSFKNLDFLSECLSPP
jgi:hypothetical protein